MKLTFTSSTAGSGRRQCEPTGICSSTLKRWVKYELLICLLFTSYHLMTAAGRVALCADNEPVFDVVRSLNSGCVI